MKAPLEATNLHQNKHTQTDTRTAPLLSRLRTCTENSSKELGQEQTYPSSSTTLLARAELYRSHLLPVFSLLSHNNSQRAHSEYSEAFTTHRSGTPPVCNCHLPRLCVKLTCTYWCSRHTRSSKPELSKNMSSWLMLVQLFSRRGDFSYRVVN